MGLVYYVQLLWSRFSVAGIHHRMYFIVKTQETLYSKIDVVSPNEKYHLDGIFRYLISQAYYEYGYNVMKRHERRKLGPPVDVHYHGNNPC